MKLSIPFVWAFSGVCAAAAVGGGAWLTRHKTILKPKNSSLAYTAKGLSDSIPGREHLKNSLVSPDPVLPVLKAYQKGHYADAEALAEPVIRQYQGAKGTKEQRYAVQAEWINAYSAARRKDYTTARERFTYLRDMAAQLPDHGKQPSVPGEIAPTLDEEGAFQRAVCTSAIDGNQAAEMEFDQFLRRYPNSVLIHGAVKRIARYHKGNVPKLTEALWKQAMQVQEKTEKAQQRAASLCGPECLSELLRRRGKPASVATLAQEMRTDENGTSVLAIASTAQKYGLKTQGLKLTQAALQQQKLPVIALVTPGHFVIIESVTPTETQIWNPEPKAENERHQTLNAAQWKQIWGGVTLVIQ